MTSLEGLHRYGGGTRRVTVDQDAAHVVLVVQAYDGDGEVLLTPAQARAIASWLDSEASIAEVIPEDGPPARETPEQLRERLAEMDPP